MLQIGFHLNNHLHLGRKTVLRRALLTLWSTPLSPVKHEGLRLAKPPPQSPIPMSPLFRSTERLAIGAALLGLALTPRLSRVAVVLLSSPRACAFLITENWILGTREADGVSVEERPLVGNDRAGLSPELLVLEKRVRRESGVSTSRANAR